MATHDYIISNASGAAVRADLNNALAAIATNNSSATEPTTTYAYQWWADTGSSPTVMKLRNATNNGWVTLFQLDGEWTVVPFENGTAAAPSIYFKDSGTDTGIYSPGTDQVAITTGGTGRFFVTSTGSVGIGTGSPSQKLEVQGSAVLFGNGSSDVDIIMGVSGYGSRLEYSTGKLSLRTNSSNRLTIDNSGNVGIGTTSPQAALTVIGSTSYIGATNVSARFSDNVTSNFAIGHPSGGGIDLVGNNGLNFCTSDGTTKSERARLDSSGRWLVGTSTSALSYAALQIKGGPSADSANICLANNLTAIASGNDIGTLQFTNQAGGRGAAISATSDGTWNGGVSHPSRLVFSTTADGASSPTERMRIASTGELRIGTTNNLIGFTNQKLTVSGPSAFSNSANVVVGIDRLSTDGDLILFYQDTLLEGSITVSGSTVSYNGAHLSRWSQLPNGAERTEILRGTVLSNIDEMCEWGDEENEQLNRMKVSDVEGDKNVSGVFQAWDDDDDTYTNDFYCAMTGDFIIRIGVGVTVERGDLLMSAGDGTAKPQEDDIIRSKTIAKVTSTNVSCTYDDGSYCVPCVLMAC